MEALLVLQRNRKSFDDLELLFEPSGLYYILLDADVEGRKGWPDAQQRENTINHG